MGVEIEHSSKRLKRFSSQTLPGPQFMLHSLLAADTLLPILQETLDSF